MRPTRIVAILAALIMAVTLSSGLMSPAQAQGGKWQVAGLKSQKVTNHKFIITGKIKQFSGKFQVTKNKKGYLHPKAKGNGRFKFTVVGNLGDCYKMVIPAKSGHSKTTVNLGCIHRV